MPLVQRTKQRHSEQRNPEPAPAHTVRKQNGHGAKIEEVLDLVKPVRDVIDLGDFLRSSQNKERHEDRGRDAKAPEPATI